MRLFRPAKFFWPYIVSVAAVTAAALFRAFLLSHAGPMPLFITFYPAVILMGILAGGWAGVVTTLLSAAVADYWFIEPYGAFGGESFHDFFALLLFIGAGLLISFMASLLAKSRVREAEALARRGAEEALRESEIRYRSFVEASAQIVWTTNERGEVNMEIPAWQAYTGQTADEARGFGWMNCIRAEDRGRVSAAWAKAFESKGIYEVEYCLRRHDGAWRNILARGVPIFDANGSVREYVGTCIDVTEQKQAQDALRESEFFHRQTLESIPGMVFTTRPDGYCDFQSQQWAEYTGVPVSEHLGDGWNNLLHPEDRPRAYEAWRAAVEEKGPYDLEYRVRRRDGVYEWFKVVGQPIRDAAGQIIRWFGVALNIEEMKQAEDALRENEERFRTLANAIPQLAWVAHADGFIYWYNQRWYQYTGTTPEQMEGWGWQSVHDPEVLPKVMERWQASIASGEPFDMEFPLRAADGTFHPFLTRVLPLKDDRGNVVQWFGTNTDITEQREVQDALRESEERARRRAEEMEKVMEVVPAAIWYSYDPECRRVVGNRMGNELFEARPNENVSPGPNRDWEVQPRRFFSDGRELGPEELPMQYAAAHNVDVRNALLDVQLPSGKWLNMMGSASPLRDAGGRVRGCLGAFVDITERRVAEENLKRLVDKLARSNRDLQRFAYVASHDLQEPLRQITAYVQLLWSRYGSLFDEDGREFMGFVVEGAKRMQSLILDLLAYSRVDSADQKLSPVSLQLALDQALHNLRLSVQENQATVTWDELPVVEADAGQLVQLFQNLIGNAIKFRGEKPPAVHVGVQRLTKEWRFSVRDNGIGFEQQYAEKIFEVFQRLHGRSAFSGTGIGLSICKRVIERHGGRIWAESEPGKGATFFFTLPAQTEESPQSA